MAPDSSPNFAFLAHHDVRLVALTTQAEQHFAYYSKNPLSLSYPLDLVRPEEPAFRGTWGKRSVGGVERGAPTVDEGSLLPVIGLSFGISKAPHQGAFDNLHMAPRMKFPGEIVGFRRANLPEMASPILGAVTRVFSGRLTALQDIHHEGMNDAEFQELFNEVTMAPICAHDCLHTHWRWSEFATNRSTKGWSTSGPYSISGAPMIPLHHGVQLWLDQDYIALIAEGTVELLNNKTGFYTSRVQTDKWEHFFYNGFSFGLSAEQSSTLTGMKHTQDLLVPGYFVDENEKSIQGSESWAVYYFHLCYGFTCVDLPFSSVGVYERVRIKNLSELING